CANRSCGPQSDNRIGPPPPRVLRKKYADARITFAIISAVPIASGTPPLPGSNRLRALRRPLIGGFFWPALCRYARGAPRLEVRQWEDRVLKHPIIFARGGAFLPTICSSNSCVKRAWPTLPASLTRDGLFAARQTGYCQAPKPAVPPAPDRQRGPAERAL